jgi:acyl phosphate:glycerol-3-phosphate acyltransferase
MSRTVLIWLVLAVVSYLLGAIPFGFLIARARGIDIRKVGSGNIGATNVFRSVGKSWGILTFALDVLKGFVPAFLFPLAVQLADHAEPAAGWRLLCGCLAIIGHNWPIYLGFKGGKGVATSTGAMLGIAPIAMLIGLGSWILVFAASRYVSLASILAAVVIACAAWPLYRSGGLLLPVALTALAILVVIRHKSNIQRLLSGTEHRFGKPKTPPAEKGRNP